MASCQRFKQETSWDPFHGALEDYPDIQNYVSNFQVNLKSKMDSKISKLPRHFKDSIVVFKKKKLPVQTLQLQSNIYDHDPTNLELDALNEKKSRTSCLRCRKFKKKCTRDLPECLNCVSCDELCIYIPRKRKSSVASTTASVELDKRDSICSTPSSCISYSRFGSQSIDSIDTKFPACETTEERSVRRRLSMPIKLPTSRESSGQKEEANYGYNSTNGSNLYMLLN